MSQRPTSCPHCENQLSLITTGNTGGIEFVKQEGTSGYRIFARCITCNATVASNGLWLAHSLFTDDEIAQMPWDGSAQDKREPCTVCGVPAKLELHHLAPREMFGDECERWPQVRVCRRCHECWHNVVNLYQERKASGHA